MWLVPLTNARLLLPPNTLGASIAVTHTDPSDDESVLEALLGRPVVCDFTVVLRRGSAPAVVCNAPFTRTGDPMPTRYWLCDPQLRAEVSRIESAGGVLQAAAALDPADIEAAHLRYAQERDAQIPTTYEGPRPSGGVGGTRVGLKCLHAHLAYSLAGGNDPAGEWTRNALAPSIFEGLQ